MIVEDIGEEEELPPVGSSDDSELEQETPSARWLRTGTVPDEDYEVIRQRLAMRRAAAAGAAAAAAAARVEASREQREVRIAFVTDLAGRAGAAADEIWNICLLLERTLDQEAFTVAARSLAHLEAHLRHEARGLLSDDATAPRVPISHSWESPAAGRGGRRFWSADQTVTVDDDRADAWDLAGGPGAWPVAVGVRGEHSRGASAADGGGEVCGGGGGRCEANRCTEPCRAGWMIAPATTNCCTWLC